MAAESPASRAALRFVTPRRPGQEPPALPVHDLKAALAHYAALGFEVPEDPAGSDSATATRDGVELRLCQSDFDPATEAGCIYLVADDPDQLWHEWSRPGIGGRGRAPRATDDDAYAGSHIDPDGNCIMFGTPVSPA